MNTTPDHSSLQSLFSLLDKAEALVAQFTGGYSNQFLSAEEFHAAMRESIVQLKNGQHEELNKLYSWFAPTCSWDDFTQRDGQELGNQIFGELNTLKSGGVF